MPPPDYQNLDVLPGTATERFVSAQPDDKFRLAMVFKRVFKIAPNGLCVPSPEPPSPIQADLALWQPDVEPPLVSALRWDSDLIAFKQSTDVVVQGHAYAYSPRQSIEAELRVGPLSRMVRVHGDRRAEWSNGRAVFTPAKPFERMPLRYERAYGGLDSVALARNGDRFGKMLAAAQPMQAKELARNTPYHYPRNPSGCGYLMDVDQESLAAVRIPNLEFPFDPITPERLAVGSPKEWVKAPLPAGFDWLHPAWFPRLAYMGFVPEHNQPRSEIPEATHGWAPREILNLSQGQFLFFDPRFQQGASPGLSIQNLPPDAELVLKNMFPSHAERRIRLPGVLPQVRIALKPNDVRKTRTQMNAAVIQPDEERVTLVLAASCEVPRRYGNHEMAAMKWSIG